LLRVIPAQAEIEAVKRLSPLWISACAGMTGEKLPAEN